MVKKCDVVYNYIFKNLLSVKVYKTAPKGVMLMFYLVLSSSSRKQSFFLLGKKNFFFLREIVFRLEKYKNIFLSEENSLFLIKLSLPCLYAST